MRVLRRITTLIAALAAACAVTVVIAPSGAAAASLETCTDWSYVGVPGVEDGFARVPSVGPRTGRIDCVLQLGDFNNTASRCSSGCR